jgi:hypothetical protein
MTAFLALASCETANINVGGALTSQGYVNRSEIALGEVYLWDRVTNTSRRVNFVEPSPNLLTPPSPRRTLDVSFTQGIEFTGGVDGLTGDQVIDLVNEVKSRSSIESAEVTSIGFRDPLDAILEEIRADRARWYRSLEVTDDLTLPDGLVLVLVSGVTSGKSLAVEVDQQVAAEESVRSSVYE